MCLPVGMCLPFGMCLPVGKRKRVDTQVRPYVVTRHSSLVTLISFACSARKAMVAPRMR